MQSSTMIIVLICFMFSLQNQSSGQRNVNPKKPLSKNNSTTIITKVPFNDIYYYIKISPMDVKDPMPVCKPQADHQIVWNDSLQHLLPDSILKLLPKKNKQRK